MRAWRKCKYWEDRYAGDGKHFLLKILVNALLSRIRLKKPTLSDYGDIIRTVNLGISKDFEAETDNHENTCDLKISYSFLGCE